MSKVGLGKNVRTSLRPVHMSVRARYFPSHALGPCVLTSSDDIFQTDPPTQSIST